MVREKLSLYGGRPCLDFVNSVDPRDPPGGKGFLPDYAALLAWCGRIGLLERDELERLGALARSQPSAAAEAYRRAIELRELLYPVLRASAEGLEPPEPLARRFSRRAAAFERSRQLTWEDGWRWEATPDRPLDLPAHVLLADALDLVTSSVPIRKCAGDRCGWLFVDTSKNHSRRWCSMAGCGNRAKGRRHYSRRREAER